MARRNKKKFSAGLTAVLSVFAVIIGLVAGLVLPLYVAEAKFTENLTTDILEVHTETFYSKSSESEEVSTAAFDKTQAEISVHFLELGNKYTGDCTLIKTGDTEILIDCGSKSNSVPTVKAYLDEYVTDGKIEYVIVTHAHQDHYAGFATPEKVDSIFDLYECKTIIDFAQTNQKESSTMYKNYKRELAAEVEKGAKHYTAAECYNNENGAKRVYDVAEKTKMEILYNKYYFEKDGSGENNHSVSCMITFDDEYNFLFTGDLEEKGELILAERYKTDHPEKDFSSFKVDLYKAGHHGSKTSSSAAFLETFKPEICCVCCCAGSPEYTKTNENQFPTQKFIDNISVWTNRVYVTTLCVDYDNDEFVSFNGNIVVWIGGGALTVSCSNENNSEPLYKSEWFKANRKIPDSWNT